MSIVFISASTALTTVRRGCYAHSLGRAVVTGSDGGTHGVATSDDGGLTWTLRTTGVNTCLDVAWNGSLFVLANTLGVQTSTDGITWTATNVVSADFFPEGITWAAGLGLWVLVGTGYSTYYGSPPDHPVWTSPDGITWTGHTTPLVASSSLIGVAWSPSLSLLAAAELGGKILTSPNGTTWTIRTGGVNNQGENMRWLPTAGMFAQTGGDTTGKAIWLSSDGITWTAAVGLPFGTAGIAFDIAEQGGTWYAAGHDSSNAFKIFESSDQGNTWAHDTTPLDSTVFSMFAIFADPDAPSLIATGHLAIYVAFVTPTPPVSRFYEGYAWRWIVTDLTGATITFLDPLAMNRQITYTLNDHAVATCTVPADNPEINITQGGDPFVSFANKLLYAFRREQPNTPQPWVCRFAGVIEELNDEITPTVDVPVTHLTAYDPWHFLDSMPVTDNIQLGLLPGQGGVTFPANGSNTAASVVVNLVKFAIAHNALEGRPMPFAAQACYIDTLNGHVPPHVTDPTPPLSESVNFTQGMTVGDALRQMTTDGLCDIIFTPIYPMNTNIGVTNPAYGALCMLNVYALAGSDQNAAVFAWDEPSNSVVGLNRMENASTMGNHVFISAGSSGIPISQAGLGDQSTQKYGPYWYIDSVTGKNAYPGVVSILAEAQLLQRRYGQPTLTLDPAPERSPIPFIDYNLGDNVPVYASTRYRKVIAPVLNAFGTGWDGLARVWTIPITMPDDAPETVSQMTVQIFPVQPQHAPEETRIMVALATNLTRARRVYGQQQRAARRLQVFYGHLSGYGYGT